MVGECPVSSFRSCPDKLLDHLQAQNRLGFVWPVSQMMRPGLKTTQSDVRLSCQKTKGVEEEEEEGSDMHQSFIKLNMMKEILTHSLWHYITLQKRCRSKISRGDGKISK